MRAALRMVAGHRLYGFLTACLAMAYVFPVLAVAQPKIRMSEEMFDFGYLPDGPHVYHRYWLHNDGSDTLRILAVQPSCGCTTLPLPTKQVRPADSVPLDLAFNTRYQNGKVQKSVLIVSNDKAMPEMRIQFVSMVGEREGVARISPRAAYLDTLGKESQVFQITNTGDTLYKITVTSPPPDFMSLELTGYEIPAKGKVTAVLKPGPKTPIGVYTGSFTLRFDGPQPHSVTAPIYGMGYYR
ncbi:MAG: DUF1573 domain-containing protein [Pseudomonadota bacterium]